MADIFEDQQDIFQPRLPERTEEFKSNIKVKTDVSLPESAEDFPSGKKKMTEQEASDLLAGWNEEARRKAEFREQTAASTGVELSWKQYDLLYDMRKQKIIDNDDVYRISFAHELGEYLQIDPALVLNNYDAIWQAVSEDRSERYALPQSRLEAISNSIQIAKNLRPMARLNRDLRNLEGLLEHAEGQEKAELQSRVSKIEFQRGKINQSNEKLSRGMPTDPLTTIITSTIQSAPSTGRSMLGGGIGAIGGGIAGAIAGAPFAGVGAGPGFAAGVKIGYNLGSIAASADEMVDLMYGNLRDAGVTPDNARRLAITGGTIQGIIEGALGVVAGWGKSGVKVIGGKVMSKELQKQIAQNTTKNFIKRVTGSGLMANIGRNVALGTAVGTLKQAGEEGIEEVLQALVDQAALSLAETMQDAPVARNSWGSPEFWDTMKSSLVGGIAGGIGFGAMGLPLTIADVKTGIREMDRVKNLAAVIDTTEEFRAAVKDIPLVKNLSAEQLGQLHDSQATERQAYQQQMREAAQQAGEHYRLAAMPTLEAPGEMRRKADGRLDVQINSPETEEGSGRPVSVAPLPTEAAPAAARRDEDGSLYTKITSRRTDADGYEEARLSIGDPWTGDSYGGISYRQDDNTIIIDSVDVPAYITNREEVIHDAVLDLAAQNKGADIEWNPVTPELLNIKDELIAGNPLGEGKGLQWFDAAADVSETRAAAPLRNTLRQTFLKNESEAHVQAAARLVYAVDRTLNFNIGAALGNDVLIYTREDLLKNPEMAQILQRQDSQGRSALDPDVAGGTFFVRDGQQVSFATASKEFGQGIKAVLFASEHADFSTFVHEFFHFVDAAYIARNPGLRGLFETALDKHYDSFTEQDREYLARNFEKYLKDGQAPNTELEGLFKKIAKAMARAWNAIQDTFSVSPKLREAFDALLTGEANRLAKDAAEAAREETAPASARKAQAGPERGQLGIDTKDAGEDAGEGAIAAQRTEPGIQYARIDTAELSAQDRAHAPTSALISRAMAMPDEAARERAIGDIRELRTRYAGTAAEFKAPNGKPSNLIEALGEEQGRQAWYAVRTPDFKKWFGDWETEANARGLFNAEPITVLSGEEFKKSEIDLVTQVEEYFKSIGGHIEREGIGVIDLTRQGIRSSIAHGIGREKAAAFKAIPDIIKNGKIIDYQTNWKGRGFNTYVIDAPIKIGSKDYIAEVIIEQNKSKRNEYYLHEVEVKEKAQSAFKTATERSAPQASKLIIAKKLEDVKGKVSQVVDENGEPLVVYHGTYEDWNTYDMNSLGAGTEANGAKINFLATALVGIWTNDKIKGNASFEKFMDLFVDIKKPEYYNLYELADEMEDIAHEIIEEQNDEIKETVHEILDDLDIDSDEEDYVDRLKYNDDTEEIIGFLEEKGIKIKPALSTDDISAQEIIAVWKERHDDIDGIIVEDQEFGGTSYVSFAPTQIKSATDNAGTYSGDDPSILFQDDELAAFLNDFPGVAREAARFESGAELAEHYADFMAMPDEVYKRARAAGYFDEIHRAAKEGRDPLVEAETETDLKITPPEETAEWLLTSEPVSAVSDDAIQIHRSEKKGGAKKAFLDAIDGYFTQSGIKSVQRGKITVLISRSGIAASLEHGYQRAKINAFTAIPEIIRHGKIIEQNKNWKGRGYDSYIIDAPITIGGKDYVGEVIINHHKDGNYTFYLHEVEEKSKLHGAFTSGYDTSAPGASALNIARLLQNVKDKNKTPPATEVKPAKGVSAKKAVAALGAYGVTPARAFEAFKLIRNDRQAEAVADLEQLGVPRVDAEEYAQHARVFSHGEYNWLKKEAANTARVKLGADNPRLEKMFPQPDAEARAEAAYAKTLVESAKEIYPDEQTATRLLELEADLAAEERGARSFVNFVNTEQGFNELITAVTEAQKEPVQGMDEYETQRNDAIYRRATVTFNQNNPNWKTAIMNTLHGKKVPERTKQILRGMIRNRPLQYMEAWAMISGDDTWLPEESDTARIARLDTEGLVDDEFLERQNPEELERIARRLGYNRVAQKIRDGTLKFNDEDLDDYDKQLQTEQAASAKKIAAVKEDLSDYAWMLAKAEENARKEQLIAEQIEGDTSEEGLKASGRQRKKLGKAQAEVQRILMEMDQFASGLKMTDRKNFLEFRRLLREREKRNAELKAIEQSREILKKDFRLILKKPDLKTVHHSQARLIEWVQSFFDSYQVVARFAGPKAKSIRDLYNQFVLDPQYRERLKGKLSPLTYDMIEHIVFEDVKTGTARAYGKLSSQQRRVLWRNLVEYQGIFEELGIDILEEPRKYSEAESAAIEAELKDTFPPDLLNKIKGLRREPVINPDGTVKTGKNGRPVYGPARVKLADFKLEDIQSLAGIVNKLRKEGRENERARKDARRELIREQQEKTLNALERHMPKDAEKFHTPGLAESRMREERRSRRLGTWFSVMNARRFFRRLEGGTDDYLYWNYTQREYEAFNEENRHALERRERVNGQLKQAGIKLTDLGKTTFTLWNGDRATLDEMLTFYYAQYNDRALHAAVFGDFATPEEKALLAEMAKARDDTGQPDLAGQLNLEAEIAKRYMNDMQKLDTFFQKTENAKYRQVMEIIGRDYDENYGRLKDFIAGEYNQELGSEPYYMPLSRLSTIAQENTDVEQALAETGLSRYINKGYTQGRVDIPSWAQEPIKSGFYAAWDQMVVKQEHLMAYDPLHRQMKQIFQGEGSRTIRHALQRGHSEAAVKYIDRFISELAQPPVQEDIAALKMMDRLMRGHYAAAVLGWRLSSIVKQAIESPAPFFQYVRPDEYVRAQIACLRKENRDMIYAKSAYMKVRYFDPAAALIHQMERMYLAGKLGKAEAALTKIESLGMGGQEWIDAVSVMPGWLAAYKRRLAELNRMTAGNGKAEQWAANAKMPRRAATVTEAGRIAAALVGQDLTNESTGFTASVSNNSLKKMVEDARAVKKSVSPAAHAAAVANIDALYENAELLESHNDRDNNPNIKQIHRFGAVMELNGEHYPVKITVKEFVSEKDGKRIYSIEAVDIDNKTASAGQPVGASNAGIQTPLTDTATKPAGQPVDANQKEGSQTPLTGFDSKISKMLEAVKGVARDSAMTAEQADAEAVLVKHRPPRSRNGARRFFLLDRTFCFKDN